LYSVLDGDLQKQHQKVNDDLLFFRRSVVVVAVVGCSLLLPFIACCLILDMEDGGKHAA
jgi:hypothetical protein